MVWGMRKCTVFLSPALYSILSPPHLCEIVRTGTRTAPSSRHNAAAQGIQCCHLAGVFSGICGGGEVMELQDTEQQNSGERNFLISEDGNLYEGRGWDTEGAHTLHYNKDSYGVCFLGSFTDETPRSAALQKVEILIRTGISRGHLRPDYILKGHRDLGDTECPGEALYEHIQTLPHFQP
ncbi:peptidoglycan-recognition protein LE-like isoform X2 [Ambystoma mexicanum]|uniref:peptidoglycan-recognition protein LE-like isoform X2 n=1 Tax=Ambystoma mexicanum TaxID=8296 RepID=UPI0037E8FB2A